MKELILHEITDDHQTRMCVLCERSIICGSSNTYHFQCEGRYCEDALELLNDELIDELEEHYETYKYLIK